MRQRLSIAAALLGDPDPYSTSDHQPRSRKGSSGARNAAQLLRRTHILSRATSERARGHRRPPDRHREGRLLADVSVDRAARRATNGRSRSDRRSASCDESSQAPASPRCRADATRSHPEHALARVAELLVTQWSSSPRARVGKATQTLIVNDRDTHAETQQPNTHRVTKRALSEAITSNNRASTAEPAPFATETETEAGQQQRDLQS